MGLRASTFKSATNFTEYYRNGVMLKSRALKRWLKRKGYGQSYLAKRLGMSKGKLRRKLYKRQRFNQSEIAALIRLMGARAAINVIWFSSLQEKRRIQNYVWGWKMSNTYNPVFPHSSETPAERKKQVIAEQEREYGEDWEQSEDFESLIFESDELPSRRFMRRRDG